MYTHYYATDSTKELHVFHSNPARQNWVSRNRASGARAIYRDQARDLIPDAALTTATRCQHHFHFILTKDHRPCAHNCRPSRNPDGAPCLEGDCNDPAEYICTKCEAASCEAHIDDLDPYAVSDPC